MDDMILYMKRPEEKNLLEQLSELNKAAGYEINL